MNKFELFYPFKPQLITQFFGVNSEYYKKEFKVNGHNGIDFLLTSKFVRATHNGIVTFTGEDGSGGIGVVVRTQEKFEYKSEEVYFKSIYWHLKDVFVKVNQKVEVGQILAIGDNTGKSTGPHLHFGLKPVAKGEADWQYYNFEQDNGFLGAIDPASYFNGIYCEYGRNWNLIKSLTSDLRVRIKVLVELVKLSG